MELPQEQISLYTALHASSTIKLVRIVWRGTSEERRGEEEERGRRESQKEEEGEKWRRETPMAVSEDSLDRKSVV